MTRFANLSGPKYRVMVDVTPTVFNRRPSTWATVSFGSRIEADGRTTWEGRNLALPSDGLLADVAACQNLHLRPVK